MNAVSDTSPIPGGRALGRARLALLWKLDARFPPDPRAFLNAGGQTTRSMTLAPEVAGRYLSQLPSTEVDILDFGCGWGGETLWLAQHARSVTGVDIEASAIAQANEARRAHGVENCAFVQATGGPLPLADRSFDAVFSTNVFEHVMDLDGAFRELYRVLRPGGVVLSRFGPLFFSPQGYHLYWACQVPYAHLLCGLDAVVALRNARCKGRRTAASWQDLGLNGYRYREFKRAARDAGFVLERFDRIPVRGLSWLAALPVIGDLLTFGIDMRLRRPC
ncbi:MAG: class I SAM-dependent methyltransferase [Acidobacteria bacterium]|nr:class I SAM-dependent methyltransferase [Acidobacteriota bacterium]